MNKQKNRVQSQLVPTTADTKTNVKEDQIRAKSFVKKLNDEKKEREARQAEIRKQ